ncbi:MAG: M3 family metallopeptidase [Myxococcales bacterium]|nr:M3 family metallopeptidase [Myxococcales bacterium]
MDAANPLLTIDTTIPFDSIRAEHVEPAMASLIADARAAIRAIADDAAPRTYASTLQALEDATEPVEVAITIIGHLESVATTPELRAAYNAVQPEVARFFSSIPLDDGLWRALRAFAETDEARGLTGARARLLGKTLDDFRRHGADLDPDGKTRLAALDVELAELTTRFAENVLDATNAWELVITDEARLAGLPPSARMAAREAAAARKIEGWRFTLQAPSVIPLLTYLDDRAIREQVYRAYNRRGADAPHDNAPVIARILELRREKAALLGYATFADLVLHDRMAHSGARARAFVDDLRARIEPAFHAENAELAAFVRGLPDAPAELAPWDIGYYAEKERRARYDFDEEALRPYFAADKVLAGIFEIVQRLYGVRVVAQPSLPAWHEDVATYALHNADGHLIGLFYADLYPRESKRGGAWMNALHTGRTRADGTWQPHVGLICANVTPPAGGAPALLTHREVETLFHEMGHLMHHLLSEVEVRSLAGTNVAWDFVELPSQIMENWCWERDALDLFAHHYESGERIPEALFERMIRARNYRSANAAIRQLSFGIVDLALHVDYDPERDGPPLARARALMAELAPAPLPEGYAMLAGFTHLFASPVGYAAAYYSYKWAEVLDADAFTRFRDGGILSPEVGGEFRRTILARGDSEDPLALFVAFMGREPDPEALLRRSGLGGDAAA